MTPFLHYNFIQGLEGPKGLHLCADVNLPYLLELGIEILSFDAFQIGFMPKEYAGNVSEFLKKGGVISWGIVPTESSVLSIQTPEKLASTLSNYWEVISDNTGLALRQIAERALIAPARCCLRDIGTETTGKCEIPNVEEKIVEKAFSLLQEISQILKEKYKL